MYKNIIHQKNKKLYLGSSNKMTRPIILVRGRKKNGQPGKKRRRRRRRRKKHKVLFYLTSFVRHLGLNVCCGPFVACVHRDANDIVCVCVRERERERTPPQLSWSSNCIAI